MTDHHRVYICDMPYATNQLDMFQVALHLVSFKYISIIHKILGVAIKLLVPTGLSEPAGGAGRGEKESSRAVVVVILQHWGQKCYIFVSLVEIFQTY